MNYSLHNVCKDAAGRAESGAAAAFALEGGGGYTIRAAPIVGRPRRILEPFRRLPRKPVSLRRKRDLSHIWCDGSLRLFHPSI